MTIQSINPATGEPLETFSETSPADIERALAGAERAFADWRRRDFAERARLMHGAARLLRERKTTYARTMAVEMGKPLAQGEAGMTKRADNWLRFEGQSHCWQEQTCSCTPTAVRSA